MHLLKQSTAATVLVGPVLDSTGTAVTTAVIGDFNLTKNGSTAALAASATATHSHNGHYLIALTTSNTDTSGRAAISVNNTAMAMPVARFEVLPAATFDALATNAAGAASGLPLLDANSKSPETPDTALLQAALVPITGAVYASGDATTTVFKTTLTSGVTDFYKGQAIVFTSEALAGQIAQIKAYTAYNGTYSIITVQSALTSAPANSVTFSVTNAAASRKLADLLAATDSSGVVSANKTKVLGTLLTESVAGRLAAAEIKFGDVATPVFTAASVNQTIDNPTANAIADGLLDRVNGIESNVTLRQAVRIMAAVLAGKVSGAGSGTETFKGLDGSTLRVTVTTDSAGNRTNVNYS